MQNGRLMYDVIDGKQRLETIFMFTQMGRFKRDRFAVKLDLEDEGPLLGTAIAGCPPHRPGRALISASGSYLG